MEMKKAVIVDAKGFFLGAVQWDSSTVPPKLNAPLAGEDKVRDEDRRFYLTDPEAIADPIPNGKWDKRKKVWKKPGKRYTLVNDRGELVGTSVQWAERLRPAPRGQQYTDKPLPKDWNVKTRRPIWNFADQEWQEPRVVAIVKGDKIVSAGLENPNEEVENIDDVTEKQTSTIYPWPQRKNGTDAKIGDEYKNGDWTDSRAEAEKERETNPRLHALSQDQFEYLLDVSGLDEVRDTVLAALKKSDRKQFARFRKAMRAPKITFDGTLKMVRQAKELGALAETIDEKKLTPLWLDAKDQ